ncbi:protein of unknown function [Pseudomonas mediterranea]
MRIGGNRLPANDGIAASVTRPRCKVKRWRISSSALSQSAISRRARGKRDSPSGVSATLRVLRLNRRPPRPSSRALMVRLRADWDRCSRSQATTKLRLWATARKARICLRVMVATLPAASGEVSSRKKVAAIIEIYQLIKSKNQLNKYMTWRNTAFHCDPIKNKRGVYGRFRQTREFL